MLVVSRFVDESVIIDLRQHGLGLVKVMLVGIRTENKARLGIEADSNIPVHREEVFNQRELGSAVLGSA